MDLPNEWLEFLSLLQHDDVRFVIVGAYAMAVWEDQGSAGHRTAERGGA